jgi:dipeptidyl aminopeptidase/acylaminoacyl peptidase
MRKLIGPTLVIAALAVAAALPAAASPRCGNGRIAFQRYDLGLDDVVVYTANPDGSHERQLLPSGAESPRWSPDGAQIAVIPHEPSDGSVAARVVRVGSGASRDLPNPDPAHFSFVACGPWSPNGARLACGAGGWGIDPSLNGIVTIRSTDGGGALRLTTNPFGDDLPGDYSPSGNRLVFFRATDAGVGLFTVKTEGGDVRQITPPGMDLNPDAGSWSPQGNEILFSAHADPDHRGSIWIVHADGTGLRELPVAGCGGAVADPASFGCFQPSWSPDGRKIAFGRYSAASDQRDIYTVDADGSGLAQVTNTPVEEENPDWGARPVER